MPRRPFLLDTQQYNNSMTDTPKDIETTLSDASRVVIDRLPRTVKVDGRTFKVKQISKAVQTRIDKLNQTAYFYQQKLRGEITLRQAHKATKKLNTLHAKTAAYYILGNLALFVPFAFAFKWRRLNLYGAKTLNKINDAGASNADVDFSLANWQLTNVQLALSTRLVGEGVKQYQERKESAESMLEKDALPKKKEDSK